MNGREGIPLLTIFGIEIRLDYSWFLIFILLTWTLAVGYFPIQFPGWSIGEYWLVGGLTAILLFVSVLVHEMAHSLVARQYGIPVREITLFIFGGVANIEREPSSPRAEFFITAVGPLTSFALAVVCWLLAAIPPPASPSQAVLGYLALMNFVLAVFNLIPGFPLDGGRILRAILWGATGSLRRATRAAGGVGRVVGYAMIFWGVWQILGGNWIGGLWIAFLGWFLENAAATQVQQQQIQSLLAPHTVADAMSRPCPEIPSTMPLQELVDEHILTGGRRCFIVTSGHDVAGLLTLHRLREVPRQEWGNVTAARAMIPAEQMKTVRPDTGLEEALVQMDRDGVNQLPVVGNSHVVGMLTREDVVSFLRTVQELNT